MSYWTIDVLFTLDIYYYDLSDYVWYRIMMLVTYPYWSNYSCKSLYYRSTSFCCYVRYRFGIDHTALINALQNSSIYRNIVPDKLEWTFCFCFVLFCYVLFLLALFLFVFVFVFIFLFFFILLFRCILSTNHTWCW